MPYNSTMSFFFFPVKQNCRNTCLGGKPIFKNAIKLLSQQGRMVATFREEGVVTGKGLEAVMSSGY